MSRLALAGLLASACAGADRPAPTPLSAAQHLERARHDEAEATAHGLRAAQAGAREGARGGRPACVEGVAAVPSPESGGEALTVMTPCFTAHERTSAVERREAGRHEAAAREHRKTATRLLDAERQACDAIAPDERDHSPFWHREDIAAVAPVVKDGHIRGVEIRFKRVAGLTEDWLRRAIACHQARAAVAGFDPSFMPYCPLALEGVSAEVRAGTDGLIVVLQAPRAAQAEAALGRAEDLLLGTP